MFKSLVATSRVLDTIDERLVRCGVDRRAFLQFCSSLMIAAPFGLPITDKRTPEDVAQGLGKVIRPPVIWLAFQDCTGCTETLLMSSHPDLADLILNVISLEYHETLMAGSGTQARQALSEAVETYSGKYICVVEGSIPTKDKGIYMKLAGRPAFEVLADVAGESGRDCRHRFVRIVGWNPVRRSRSNRRGWRGGPAAREDDREYSGMSAESLHAARSRSPVRRVWHASRIRRRAAPKVRVRPQHPRSVSAPSALRRGPIC